MRWGDIVFIETVEPVLAFTRSFESETVLAVFNLADTAIKFELPVLDGSVGLDGHGMLQGTAQGRQLHLPGYAVWFATL